MSSKHMNCPKQLGDSTSDGLFRMQGYHTLHVLDQQGRVEFTLVGNNEALSDIMGKVLSTALTCSTEHVRTPSNVWNGAVGDASSTG